MSLSPWLDYNAHSRPTVPRMERVPFDVTASDPTAQTIRKAIDINRLAANTGIRVEELTELEFLDGLVSHARGGK